MRPRETVTTAFDIDDRLDWARVLLQWQDGDVQLSLTSPSGVVHDRTRIPDRVVQDNGPTWDLVEVPDPERGRWTVALRGLDVAVTGTEVAVTWPERPVNDTDRRDDVTSDGHSWSWTPRPPMTSAGPSSTTTGISLPRSSRSAGEVVSLTVPAGQPGGHSRGHG